MVVGLPLAVLAPPVPVFVDPVDLVVEVWPYRRVPRKELIVTARPPTFLCNGVPAVGVLFQEGACISLGPDTAEGPLDGGGGPGFGGSIAYV